LNVAKIKPRYFALWNGALGKLAPMNLLFMKRLVVPLALLCALPTTFAAGHILKPVGKIGVGWDGRKFAWMSFVAFSPDGRMVASDGPATPDDASGDLTFWTFPGGRLINRFHEGPSVLSPAWGYLETKKGIQRIKAGVMVPASPENTIDHGVFSRDDRFLAASADGEPGIRIVSMPGGKQVGTLMSSGRSVAFSPNDKLLAAGHWNSVALWNIASQKRVGMLRGFGRYVISLAFAPHGTLLAVGTDLGALEIWDVRHRKRLHRIDLGGGEVSTPAFSPDGRLVAAGVYGTGSVWLVDVRTGKISDRQKVSDLGCGSVAFSPDGRYLIAPSTGGLISWPYDVGGAIRVFRVLGRQARAEIEGERSHDDRRHALVNVINSIGTIIKSERSRPGRPQPQ
jgi:hypothetical protein